MEHGAAAHAERRVSRLVRVTRVAQDLQEIVRLLYERCDVHVECACDRRLEQGRG